MFKKQKPKIIVQKDKDNGEETEAFPGVKMRSENKKDLKELLAVKEEAFPGILRRSSLPMELRLKALYDYDAKDPSQLSFKTGDILKLISKNSDNWWMGSLRDKSGYVPSNYVSELKINVMEETILETNVFPQKKILERKSSSPECSSQPILSKSGDSNPILTTKATHKKTRSFSIFSSKPLARSSHSNILLTNKENNVFNTTLQKIMEKQKKSEPNLPIPKILHFCLDLLKSMGGLETEGILRIPGSQETVNRLAELFENGNYDVSNVEYLNTHDVAGTIKFWFKKLTEPLIPRELYNEALYSEGKENINQFFDKLPSINKLVIKTLIEFCRELSNFSETTKMDPLNISVCLAPNLFNVIIDHSTSDPSVLLMNSDKEKNFFLSLMKFLE
eukprot:TRINITY_DN9030_c0_g1_i1.p1 TRINITY_DN9030_c0_g1~~TRINITY_DN9030_c0_g1_i1.p1  ORF type:complete len:391 (+),score=115.48 TRINITY_DN9030_c0_g1_i1:341-1513(+)